MNKTEIQLKQELINSVIDLIISSKFTTITFKKIIISDSLDFTEYEIEMELTYKENLLTNILIKKVRFQEENISNFQAF